MLALSSVATFNRHLSSTDSVCIALCYVFLPDRPDNSNQLGRCEHVWAGWGGGTVFIVCSVCRHELCIRAPFVVNRWTEERAMEILKSALVWVGFLAKGQNKAVQVEQKPFDGKGSDAAQEDRLSRKRFCG